MTDFHCLAKATTVSALPSALPPPEEGAHLETLHRHTSYILQQIEFELYN